MNLFRAELRRFAARRFTRVMLLLVIGILLMLGGVIAADSTPPSAAATAQAAREADRERAYLRAERTRCETARDNPTSADRDRYGPELSCDEMFDESWVTTESHLPNTFRFRGEASGMVLTFGALFVMVGFALGASFIGAEWSSGSLMNLLTWQPRRVPVLLTKVGALLAGLLVLGVPLGALWIAALYGVAAVRGEPAGATAGLFVSLGLDTARALALGLAAAVAGFALASIGRHTATALGALIGWAVVMEIGLRLALEMAQVGRVERWFGSTYVAAWMQKRVDFLDMRRCGESPACEPGRWAVDYGDAALVLGPAVLLLLVAAVVVIRRRDVT